MDIQIIEDSITLEEIRKIAEVFYVDMVKGVADIEKEVFALGGEYHMDSNLKLIEHGSKQKDVWGFNLYLDKPREDWLEYTSLINIRPLASNRSMRIEDEDICNKIKKIVNSKII